MSDKDSDVQDIQLEEFGESNKEKKEEKAEEDEGEKELQKEKAKKIILIRIQNAILN